MKIKTVFNEDIRVHSFGSEDDVTVDALAGAISKCYNISKPFTLTYEDSDGDIVTIQSNEDLKFAIEDAAKVLKIRVKKETKKSDTKPKEVTVEVCDPNAPESDDEDETEFEIEEKNSPPDEEEEEEEEDGEEGEQNVYEIYCDDLLDNEELQKEVAACIKFALGRLRQGDNIQTAVETALAAHEMIGDHPLVQKILPKLPTFAVKAQMWAPIAANIQDAQVDMFFQMVLAKLRAVRDGPDYPNFSFLQRHPFFGHIFSQFDAYTEPGENGDDDVHVKFQQKEIIHKQVACDGCNAEPIKGVRYKCAVCPNYDLCEGCESKHDPAHPLIKMNVTLDEFHGKPVGLREFLRQSGARGGRCGRGGRHGGRGRFGHCGGGGRGGGFGRRWMRQFQQMQQMMDEVNEQNENENENETPLNPDAPVFNPLEFMFGGRGGCGRFRGGRGRGGKKCGRGKCHGKGKGGKGGKCGKGKEGKKHWRHEKKNKGPLDYDAKLIRHMNLEDDTPVGSGILVKTWRIKNSGLKTWNKGDVAVVYDGKPFHHLVDGARFDIAGPVEPSQEVDVSVVLNVPEGFNGDSLVKYRLKCGDIKFGPPLKVKIRVVGDQITEIQKVKKFGHGKKNEEKKLAKAEKQLERIENQRQKLEQRADKVQKKIEELTKKEEIVEEEETKDEPPVVEEEEETQITQPEKVSSSSSFEVVDQESDNDNDDDETSSQQEGYSFSDFSNGWAKRHLRQTSTESIKRAFFGLKPNEDGVVEADVVEKFFDEFTKLSKPLAEKKEQNENESEDENEDEDEEGTEQQVEVEAEVSVLVEEDVEDDVDDAPVSPIAEPVAAPKPKEKEFVEPKPFPYQAEVEQLTVMGFNEDLVRNMLERNGGNVQAVLNEILG